MIKVGFDVKYGHNEVEIPVHNARLFPDTAQGTGLSNLNAETFTVINQIPEAQGKATKVRWVMHKLNNCARRDGIYDKSTNTMSLKSNNWTVYLHDWQSYKAPNFIDGYYSLTAEEQERYWTLNVGDLVIFADVSEDAPTDLRSFNDLVSKYKDMGGTITSSQAYVSYKNDGTPFRSNHIEGVKA